MENYFLWNYAILQGYIKVYWQASLWELRHFGSPQSHLLRYIQSAISIRHKYGYLRKDFYYFLCDYAVLQGHGQKFIGKLRFEF